MLPLVATMDVKNVTVAVVDNDNGQLSRRIISDIGSTKTLKVEVVSSSRTEAMKSIEEGTSDVLLTIPTDYSRKMLAGNSIVSVEANGVNPTTGMLGAQYVSQSVMNTLSQWWNSSGLSVPQSAVSVVNLYNPTLDYLNFMIPGLIVVLLIIICGFLPTLFVMFAIIMIFQLMGGLFTPIRSMPQWAQILTYAIPPRYFIEIMRSVYLKGSSFIDLPIQFTGLTAFALFTCILAALTYKKRS